MAIEIRALRAEDDRAAFHSGDVDLDRFFTKYAAQNQFRHHIGTTYVAVEGDVILGYATVAAANVEGEVVRPVLRRAVPRYPLPVLRLARLAVASTARDRGVGSALLRHVLGLALRMAEEYGCVGILVDAKPDAVEYYRRVGFSHLDVTEGSIEERPHPIPMFLPLELIAKAARPR